MDVGMMMIFAGLWLGGHRRRPGVGRRAAAGAAGGRSRLRRAVVGRASLLRLLVLPGQPPAHDVSRRRVSEHRPRHRGGDPAVARSAARRRAGGGARPSVQGTAAAWPRARPRPARVRGVPRHDGRIARALRRGGADDRERAAHRRDGGRRQALPAAAHRDPAAAEIQFRRPHLCGGVERGLGGGGGAAWRAHGDVLRPAVADAAAGDPAQSRPAPQIPWHARRRPC